MSANQGCAECGAAKEHNAKMQLALTKETTAHTHLRTEATEQARILHGARHRIAVLEAAIKDAIGPDNGSLIESLEAAEQHVKSPLARAAIVTARARLRRLRTVLP